LAAGRHQQVVTRFPPEPNGYLHIGHAIIFNSASRGVRRNLQPAHGRHESAKEELEYESILTDVLARRRLGRPLPGAHIAGLLRREGAIHPGSPRSRPRRRHCTPALRA
jgi:hypothetical protein